MQEKLKKTDHSDSLRLKDSVSAKNDEVREVGKHKENGDCSNADDD